MDTVYILTSNCGIIGVYKNYQSALDEKNFHEYYAGVRIEKWKIR